MAPEKKKPRRSVHPDIVARAFIDTTLVVIPQEAFKKLAEKFPNAGKCRFSDIDIQRRELSKLFFYVFSV